MIKSKYRFIKSIWAYERVLEHNFKTYFHIKKTYASHSDKYNDTNNHFWVNGWIVAATKRELNDINIKSNSPFFGHCVNKMEKDLYDDF